MLPFTDDELLSQLALTFIDGIGPKTGRALLSHFGSAAGVLRAPVRTLQSIPGMGAARAKACKDSGIMHRAEDELRYIRSNGVQSVFLTDPAYPGRLKACEDAPLMLFYQGTAPLNAVKTVAIVGTRKNTDYGLRITEQLVESLQGLDDIVVISGLAYGIDAIAHRKCLTLGIPTIGVVAHGLDKMYPAAHRSLAKDMRGAGGVLTEFPSGTDPDRQNFPLRNRIVAGLCDVTVITESDEKGGAMITAYVAASYNREVAAFPGRITDPKSGGPNKLIRKQIASCLCQGQDLADLMGWATAKPDKKQQQQLFSVLSPEEQQLATALQNRDAAHADELMLQTGLSPAQIGSILLQMEMNGIVRALPGKMFRLA